MPFDPEDKDSVSKLSVAMVRSNDHIRKFRKKRYQILQQYVGWHHQEHQARRSVPLNLITDFVDTYAFAMTPTNPTAYITVQNGTQNIEDSARKLQMAVDHLIGVIDLSSTLYFNVFDALISTFSVMKIGLLTGPNVTTLPGFLRTVGQIFANHVLLDNWIHDINATSWDSITYAGDEDFPTREELVEEGVVTEQEAEELPTVEVSVEKGVKPAFDTQGLKKRVSRWQMWLPQERQIVTFVGDERGPTAKTLGEPISWTGPDEGPYINLSLKPIPGRTFSLSPASSILELHELDNVLFHKASDQARDAKLVFGARRGQHQDANKLRMSPDREMVTVDADPSMIKDFHFPGPDQGILGMHAITGHEFNVRAGNLSLLNGTAAQTDTARQDELLDRNANGKVDAQRTRVTTFTGKVLRTIAWYLFTDPLVILPLSRQVPRTNKTIPTTFTPDDQKGDFFDYNVTVNPTSMAAQTPERELSKLVGFLNTFYDRYRQEMAQMGVAINWPELIKEAGNLMGIQNADRYIMLMAQPAQTPQSTTTSPGGQPRQPVNAGKQSDFETQLLQSIGKTNAA